MSTHAVVPAKSTVKAQARAPMLQRKCDCGGSAGHEAECEDCKKKKLQRRAVGDGPGIAPPIVHQVLQSSGQPLDAQTRSYFEPRFGHDFSKVRVHTDSHAQESARAVNALAYTVGPHVVFGAGHYFPTTPAGRRLIAHELTHVVQQGAFEAACDQLFVGHPGDSYEREAETLSSLALQEPARSEPRRNVDGISRLRRSAGRGVIQRSIPTGISLKETHALGHGDLKTEEDKKKYLTYIADVSLMQLTPTGDYTSGQQKGECTKEFLTEVSNTCPGTRTFCEGDKCFQVNQYKRPVGDGHTGVTVPDGPDTFVDFHRARFDTSFLEGSGKKQCSVVCHQLYKYRTEPDKKYHELAAFYLIRNFRADKFTPSGAKSAINITTGEIRKIPAGSNAAPSKADFATKVAPGLVKSGDLLDAPTASSSTTNPAPTSTSTTAPTTSGVLQRAPANPAPANPASPSVDSKFKDCSPDIKDDLSAKHPLALNRVDRAISALSKGWKDMDPADQGAFRHFFDPAGSGEIDESFIKDVRNNYRSIRSYMGSLTFDCNPASGSLCGGPRKLCRPDGNLMWTCFGALHICRNAYIGAADDLKIDAMIHESTHNALHTTDREYSSSSSFNRLKPRGSLFWRILRNIPVLGALFRLIRASNDTLYNPDSYSGFAMQAGGHP